MPLLLDLQSNAPLRLTHAIRSRAHQDVNPVLRKYRGDFFRDVGVLAIEQLAGGLDDGHATTEAAKHLPKLQADVATSENDQMFRNRVQLHDGSAVKKGYGLQAVECRHGWTRTSVDEDLPCGECSLPTVFLPDEQGPSAGETGLAEDQLKIRRFFDASLAASAKAVHDIALALPNTFHVDTDGSGVNAI